MRLQISPRNHEHINRKISSGRYGSADEVLHAALALLDERKEALGHELRDVRVHVEKATAEADAGELVPAAEVFAELRQRNAALARQDYLRRKIQSDSCASERLPFHRREPAVGIELPGLDPSHPLVEASTGEPRGFEYGQ